MPGRVKEVGAGQADPLCGCSAEADYYDEQDGYQQTQ
jgi:hypothetical protein